MDFILSVDGKYTFPYQHMPKSKKGRIKKKFIKDKNIWLQLSRSA